MCLICISRIIFIASASKTPSVVLVMVTKNRIIIQSEQLILKTVVNLSVTVGDCYIKYTL